MCEVKTKQCKDCKEVKELNGDNFRFAKDKRSPNGGVYRSRCWTCERVHQKAYDKSRIDKRRKWNEEKRDKDKDRKWAEENRDRIREHRRRYNKIKRETTPSCLSIKQPKRFHRCRSFTMSIEKCETCRDNRIAMSEQRMIVKMKVTNLKRYYKQLERVTKDCVVCGKEYIHTQYYDGTGNKTCSFNCQDINNKRQKRKDNHKRRAAYVIHDMFLNKTKASMDAEQGGRCKHCNEQMNLNHSCNVRDAEVDHIIPVSKGGLHWDVNLQLLCRGCNVKKMNTLIIRQLKQGALSDESIIST